MGHDLFPPLDLRVDLLQGFDVHSCFENKLGTCLLLQSLSSSPNDNLMLSRW
jgi:hypothetical protein